MTNKEIRENVKDILKYVASAHSQIQNFLEIDNPTDEEILDLFDGLETDVEHIDEKTEHYYDEITEDIPEEKLRLYYEVDA